MDTAVPQRSKKARPVPQLSPSYLQDQAFRYLQRYSPTAWQLRRVLLRRVDRCLAAHGGDREVGVAWVDTLVEKLVQKSVIDDARYAAAWVDSLHTRGISARGIRGRLRQRGVSGELVEEALQALEDSVGEDAELLRACAYARRRRLGPFRWDPAQRAERAKKDLAAMVRAGFPYGIARQVVDAEDAERLVAAAETDPGPGGFSAG